MKFCNYFINGTILYQIPFNSRIQNLKPIFKYKRPINQLPYLPNNLSHSTRLFDLCFKLLKI